MVHLLPTVWAAHRPTIPLQPCLTTPDIWNTVPFPLDAVKVDVRGIWHQHAPSTLSATPTAYLFFVGNSCWRGNKIPVLRWNRPFKSSTLVLNSRSLKAFEVKLKVRKENHYTKQNIYRTFTFKAHWLLYEASVLNKMVQEVQSKHN